MSSQDPDDRSQPCSRFQFSLQTLMGLTAVLSLLMGMWAWRGERGVLEFFLGTGVCLVLLGLVRRRVRLIACGTLVVIGIEMALSFSAGQTAVRTGSGWQTVPLSVCVIDAVAKEPIAGATVQVFSGSDSSRSNTPLGERIRTGPNGRVGVDTELSVIISEYDTLFGTQGQRWISLDGVWAKVEAPRYQSAWVYLPDRLGRSRPLEGDPLPAVTVEMKRAPAEIKEVTGVKQE